MLNRSVRGVGKTVGGLLRPFNVPGWKKAHTPIYCIMTLRQVDKCVNGNKEPSFAAEDLNELMQALITSGTHQNPLNASLAAQAMFLLLKLGVSPNHAVIGKLIPLASEAVESQDICSLVWSIASCAACYDNKADEGLPHALLVLYHAATAKALSNAGALSSKDVGMLLWAIGRLEFSPQNLMLLTKVLSEDRIDWDCLAPRDMAMGLSGLAKAGLSLPSHVVDSCCRRKDLKLREAVHILWAVVKSAGEWRPQLDVLVPIVRREWNEPNSRDAIMAIWALVHSGNPSTIAWAVSPERLSGISMHMINDQDRAAYAFALGQAASTMSVLKVTTQLRNLAELIDINSSPREMSFFLWACACSSRFPANVMSLLYQWVAEWYSELVRDVSNTVRMLWAIAVFDARGASRVVPVLYAILRQHQVEEFSSKEAAITLWSLFAICGCTDILFARQLATRINPYERAHRAQLYQASLTLQEAITTDPGARVVSSSALHTKVCLVLGSEWCHEYAVVPGVVVDIAKPDEKIAVEVNGNLHYIEFVDGSERPFPDGATSWKIRYLVTHGWVVSTLVEDDIRLISHLPFVEQKRALLDMIAKNTASDLVESMRF